MEMRSKRYSYLFVDPEIDDHYLGSIDNCVIGSQLAFLHILRRPILVG